MKICLQCVLQEDLQREEEVQIVLRKAVMRRAAKMQRTALLAWKSLTAEMRARREAASESGQQVVLRAAIKRQASSPVYPAARMLSCVERACIIWGLQGLADTYLASYGKSDLS